MVLIDNPGFNLHLAKKIHALKIPIVYYIAPQVWAWAPKRVLKIKRTVKKVLVVFEFEKKIYEDQGIPVAWVGHPLKDIVAQELSSQTDHPKGRTVALLPGSRKGELKMLLSAFLKSAEKISKRLPAIHFALIKSPTMHESFYKKMLEPLERKGIKIELVQKNSYAAIRSSEIAIVCSGTATLECALLGVPMIIAYKGSFLSYVTAKSLVKLPYIGLPNIVLGEKKFPELLQYDATAGKIADTALKILEDEKWQSTMKADLAEVSRRLGEPGAIDRTAREILNML